MDHGSFDRIAHLLGEARSRRATLGALLAAGVLGASETRAAKHKKKRRTGKKGKGGVSAQLVCPPPANGVNRSNCDYTGEDFSGELIHSSTYRNTIFRNAELVKTDLHGSGAKGASFRDANLCDAELYSSTLTNVNFRNANLTRADLHSSGGCGSADFTGATFCETILCDGSTDSSGCFPVNPLGVCCDFSDCTAGNTCNTNQNRCCFSNNTNVGAQPASVCCSLFKCTSGSQLNRCKSGPANCPA